jgi:hypothetical protein
MLLLLRRSLPLLLLWSRLALLELLLRSRLPLRLWNIGLVLLRLRFWSSVPLLELLFWSRLPLLELLLRSRLPLLLWSIGLALLRLGSWLITHGRCGWSPHVAIGGKWPTVNNARRTAMVDAGKLRTIGAGGMLIL